MPHLLEPAATPTGDPATDRGWLARAVALGASVHGLTGPNPPVGCVLVSEHRIVGEGATRETGGPHAEAVALADAGATAAGATAYVTLEPCAHHGRTPPCAPALVDAGVRRVVVAHPDPNPLAAGGREQLTAAGVEVVGPPPPGDLLREAVARQLEGFLTAVRLGRPHVTLKVAQTSDGRLTARDGGWVTGRLARRSVHRWRGAVDAVLVGTGTVLADDPRLDVREVPAPRQPRAVVLTSRAELPDGAAVLRPGTIVVTSTDATPARVASLRAHGCEVEVVPADAGGLDLEVALRRLTRLGVTSVLAEPGRTLGQALLTADLVDRLVVHVADHGGGTVVVPALAPLPVAWRPERVGGIGPDAVVQYTRVRTPERDGEGG